MHYTRFCRASIVKKLPFLDALTDFYIILRIVARKKTAIYVNSQAQTHYVATIVHFLMLAGFTRRPVPVLMEHYIRRGMRFSIYATAALQRFARRMKDLHANYVGITVS